jgi:hypothetical protein
MSAPLLTPDEIRAAMPTKAAGLSDTDLEALALRIRTIALAVLEQAVSGAHTAPATQQVSL